MKISSKIFDFGLRHRSWLFPAGVAVFLMGVFLEITFELHEGELDPFDRWAMGLVVKSRHPFWAGPAIDITALGSFSVITIFCLLGVLVFSLLRDRQGALMLTIGTFGSYFWTNLAKKWISRPRPEVERLVEVAGYSYPSGHSLGAASFYFLLALLVMRHFSSMAAKAVLLLSSLVVIGLVAASRVYLGVHYPTDVAAGILCGVGWACVVASASSLIKSRSLIRR